MFQQESIFCSKISSRVSLFISSGGNQFWRVHFYHGSALFRAKKMSSDP